MTFMTFFAVLVFSFVFLPLTFALSMGGDWSYGKAPSQRKERKLEKAIVKRRLERERIDQALAYERLSIDDHVELMRAKLFPHEVS